MPKFEQVKDTAPIVTAICTVLLVPMLGWVGLKIMDYGERLVALETWRGQGQRYTRESAERDFGVIVEKVNDNTLAIKDNTDAIRSLERNN